MTVRRKSEAISHKNSDACVAYEYDLPTADLDSAVIELSGRYPAEGWVLNTACTSLIYVIKGEGSVSFQDMPIDLHEGDQVLIKKDKAYSLDGHMKLLFSASPAWTPDQARIIK